MKRAVPSLVAMAVILLAAPTPAHAAPFPLLTPFPVGGVYESENGPLGSQMRYRIDNFFDVFVDIDFHIVSSNSPVFARMEAMGSASGQLCHTMSGPLQCEAIAGVGDATALLSPPAPNGIIDTEMVLMNFTGGSTLGPLHIRESPTRQSLGQTNRVGAGFAAPDSFFDIFTELSLDGGQTWHESLDQEGVAGPDSSDRFSLAPQVAEVPEPSTLLLMGGGLALVARRLRRNSSVRGRIRAASADRPLASGPARIQSPPHVL